MADDYSWSQTQGGEPSLVGLPTVGYDPANGQIVMYGGLAIFCAGEGVNPTNNTWVYSAGGWQQAHPLHSPPALVGAAMLPTPTGLLLIGGLAPAGLSCGDFGGTQRCVQTVGPSSEAWSWNGSDWVDVGMWTSGPSGRLLSATGNGQSLVVDDGKAWMLTPPSPLPATGPATSTPAGVPSDLGFPFPEGSSYIFNGPHSFNEIANPLYWGGMDFWAPGVQGNSYAGGLNGAEIDAAHNGIVEFGPSGCSVLEVYHVDSNWKPDGWATIYYHVAGFTHSTGDRVHRGDKIGVTNMNPPTTADITRCGGPSCGPAGFNCTAHVHMSLYRNVPIPRSGCSADCGFSPGMGGQDLNEYGLDGLCIGGYVIHRSENSYYGWLVRGGGGPVYAYQPVTNDGWAGCSPPVGDACVIGHWSQQASNQRGNFGTGPVTVTGPNGVSWTVSASGKLVIDAGTSDTLVGTDGFGTQWKELWRGSTTFTVHAKANQWTESAGSGTVTSQVFENGAPGVTSTVNWSSTPKYSCNDAQLVLMDSSGKTVYTLTR
jgi:hypothetical protein